MVIKITSILMLIEYASFLIWTFTGNEEARVITMLVGFSLSAIAAILIIKLSRN